MIAMTTDSASQDGNARQLLSSSRELTRRVRNTQRATWFPLLVFAAVTFAAIPIDRYGHYALTCRTRPPARVCSVYNTAGFVYWPIALVLAYVAIAGFYLRRSADRGVGSRARPYVSAGIVIAVLVTAASIWAAHHPPIGGSYLGFGPRQGFGLLNRLTGPACAIGLALLVLAWVERSRSLLVFTLGYLAVVLIPIDFGWTNHRPSPWAFLPHLVIDGSLLLLAGIAFALAQRPASRLAT